MCAAWARGVPASLASLAPAPGALRFLLARHGQTTFNAEKRFQGTLSEEPVLTEKGVAQAKALGEWVDSVGYEPPEGVAKVFVSPLKRAQQTLAHAREVAAGLPEAAALAELREIALYEWQGRTQAEIKEADPENFRLWKERAWELFLGANRPVVPDLWDQAAEAWKLMREDAPAPEQGTSLVVAHGTLGKALLSTALGLPPTAFRHFALQNGEVVEVAWPADEGEALWRRRYPELGPWRSRADEEASMDEVTTVDAA